MREILTNYEKLVALGLGIVILLQMGNISWAETRKQKVSSPAGTDEFVGPFPSWANAQTTYHATGDGMTDDTVALQTALDELGTPGHSMVLYLPAGTYRITHTLTMKTRINISLLGEDPATTTIRWDGASDEVMLDLNGVSYSRFGRLTWDGAGHATACILHGWDGTRNYANSESSHEDEMFKNAAFGIRGGGRGFQDAECEIARCRFSNLSKAGVSIENYNALDWFIWNSCFEDCATGVTNRYGAGNFHVYQSVFHRSTQADISIGNTAYFGLRGNVSVGSKRFLDAANIGAPCPITLQGNFILNSQDPTPISVGNGGPLILLDNIIESQSSTANPIPAVVAADWGAAPISVGNTFSASDAFSIRKSDRCFDNRIVPPGSIVAPVLRLYSTAPRLSRPVIEVASGSSADAIQSAIDRAVKLAGRGPVVHFPAGDYFIAKGLILPAGSDIQLVGDGFGTALHWSGPPGGTILTMRGPSHARIREMEIEGKTASIGLAITHTDQTGGSISADQLAVHGHLEAGLTVRGLASTQVQAVTLYDEGCQKANVRVLGRGRLPSVQVSAFGGATSDTPNCYEVDNGGALLVTDTWYEGGDPTYMTANGSGTFTLNGAMVAAGDRGHKGTPLETGVVTLNGFQGRFAFLGVIFGPGNKLLIHTGDINTNVLAVMLGYGPLSDKNAQADYFVNQAFAAHAVRLSSLQYDEASSGRPIAEIGKADPVWMRGMLASLRSAHPHPLTEKPTGVTDLRLFRVSVRDCTNGVVISP